MTDPPRQFQHYEVLRRVDGSPWELGRGAMGVTYKAYDVNLCCEVALKVVNSALLDHPDARDRFVREARAAAALRHRHVASVYHLGNDGQHFFYAMEFIDGETLDALVKRRGPLPVGAVLKIILQVAKALVAADRQHLVHRDLKPTNLMIVHEDADEETTVKVIDFGLARQAAGADGAAQVTIGGFVGTPQYASPEQLEEHPLDARSDIYSLGVTAWFLLLGRPPFSGSLASVCQQQLSKPPPWEQLPPSLDESVRRLLGLMLEKDPARRPQSARELRTEIERCLEALPPEVRSAALLAPLGAPAAATTPRTETPPTAFANGRYTVLTLLDEEPGVKIYRARDEDQARRLVTLRTLPRELTGDRASEENLAEEVRLIQAAAHPNLVELFSFALPQEPAPAFLVEEPLASFSLHELLTVRQTHLPAPEALRFLEPAAAAADHAAQRRLEHLDLSLRRVRLHFPYARPGSDESELRGMLSLRLAEWPEWNLKIHPFATDRPALEPGTWTGDVTLAHAINLQSLVAESAPEEGNPYLPALARLAYELLGGTLPVRAAGSRVAPYASLPSLDEAGNAVLRQAFTDARPFATCHDFYTALAKVAAGRPDFAPPPTLPTGRTQRKATQPTSLLPSQTARTAMVPPEPSPWTMPPVDEERAALPAGVRGVDSSTVHAPVESIADLIAGREPAPPLTGADLGEGTAWERMSLAEPESPHPVRWLFVLAAVVLVFGAAFAGVLFLLLHGGATSKPAARGQWSAPPTPTPLAKPIGQAQVAVIRPPVHPVTPTPPPVTVVDVKPESPPVVPDPTPLAATPTPGTPAPTPEVAKMTVRLESDPAGAMVWRDDQRLGETPADTKLPPGDYDLIYRKPGWQATHQYLHVDNAPSQTPEVIHLVPANYDPLQHPPADRRAGTANPGLRAPERRPGLRGNTVPVRPALPVAPAGKPDQTPVLRAVPIQPFRQPAANVRRGNEVQTSPHGDDEDED